MSRFAEMLDQFFYRPDEPVPPALDSLSLLEESAPPPVEEVPGEYLAFSLGGGSYAVAIGEVREIVRLVPLTEVPRGASNLLGVMGLRGEVLPVYDIRGRLKLPGQMPLIAGPEADLSALPRSARVLVLHGDEGVAGVLVDSVTGVVRLRPSEIEPPPSGTGEGGCVSGLGYPGEQLCILLDIQQALS